MIFPVNFCTLISIQTFFCRNSHAKTQSMNSEVDVLPEFWLKESLTLTIMEWVLKKCMVSTLLRAAFIFFKRPQRTFIKSQQLQEFIWDVIVYLFKGLSTIIALFWLRTQSLSCTEYSNPKCNKNQERLGDNCPTRLASAGYKQSKLRWSKNNELNSAGELDKKENKHENIWNSENKKISHSKVEHIEHTEINMRKYRQPNHIKKKWK